jgi:hypothetical protein
VTRKRGWEEPTTGPDWVDCEMLMRAIGALHSGHVAVILSPDGIGSSGGVDVAASMLFDVLPGSQLPPALVTHARWPCNTHRTLAAHAFSLLHDLDVQIGRTYQNETLWK